MLGPGRPAKRPSIDAVRELTVEEVRTTPRSRTAAVIQLRDTHHMLARLVAMGLRNPEISARTGYSLVRISILKNDPAFQELVASYRNSVDEQWRESVDEYFENASFVRTASMRLIRDRLEANGDEVPLNQLVAIHADTADRTGYPKRKESVNLNVDFAARLEQAVRRSTDAMKTIEHSSGDQTAPLSSTSTPAVATASHSPVARFNPLPNPTMASQPDGRDPLPSRDGVVGAQTAQAKRMDAPAPGPSSSYERRA